MVIRCRRLSRGACRVHRLRGPLMALQHLVPISQGVGIKNDSPLLMSVFAEKSLPYVCLQKAARTYCASRLSPGHPATAAPRFFARYPTIS